MTFANVLMGLTIGFPIMVVAGPISILLLDQGLERGTRNAAPAVFGVALADLTFSVVAAIAGATVAMLLEPVAGWLTVLAVSVLVWLAAGLARSAFVELRSSGNPSGSTSGSTSDAVVSTEPVPSLVGAGPTNWQVNAPVGEQVGCEGQRSVGAESIGETTSMFGSLNGPRLAAAFYGLTMVNPLTIVLFSSVVIAGGPGVGSAGWALGMALASFVAHGAYVLVGSALGTRLSARATAVLRGVAALFMAGLAMHFLLG